MRTVSVSLLALALAGQAHAQSAPNADAPTPAATTDTTPRGNDIVVTATRSGDAIPIALIGSSVTVIDNADLQARQTRILSDVLRDVPGVAVNRTGGVGGFTQVRIRGGESNHTLVFIDGIKADDPYNGEYDFGTLLNDEASRVEVLRGQQSALYGSDAIGGVISYTTLSGREQPGYLARVEGGSMGTLSAGARAAGVSGDTLDYALSSSYYRTDGYPTAPGGSRDLGSNSLGATAKTNWTPAPNLKLTAVGRYSLTKAQLNDQAIAPTSPVVQGYRVITAIDTPGDRTRNRGWYGLLGAAWSLFDDAWTNSVSGALTDNRRDNYDLTGRSFGDVGRRYRGSFNSTVRFGNEHVKNRFTLATDVERQTFHNTTPGGFANTRSHRLDTTGTIAQYDLTVDDRLALGASARIDHFNLFRDVATYRATGSYLLRTGTRVHAAYGTGIKAPTPGELFGYSNGLFIGNPDLRPEKSKGWEAGVEQGFGQAAKIGATYFRNRFTDQIDVTYVFVPATGAFLQQSYNNDVRTRQQGVEVYGSARVRAFRLDASYTYLKAPQTISALAGPPPAGGGFQPSGPIATQAVHRPKNIASVNLTYAPEALPLTATVTVRYTGRQRDYAFNADYSRLLVDLKAFTLVNLNATYDLNRHLQLFGRVENLLDRNYQEVFTFDTPGRAAYGGVRVKI